MPPQRAQHLKPACSRITKEQLEKLVDASIEASKYSYSPYSKFKVGAALLLPDGSHILGCNVENCSYPNGNCAEKTAIVKAVSQGNRQFVAIAVSCPSNSQVLDEFGECCGACRQVIAEFCPDNFPIYLVRQSDKRYKRVLLGDYLPSAFRPEDLAARQ